MLHVDVCYENKHYSKAGFVTAAGSQDSCGGRRHVDQRDAGCSSGADRSGEEDISACAEASPGAIARRNESAMDTVAVARRIARALTDG